MQDHINIQSYTISFVNQSFYKVSAYHNKYRRTQHCKKIHVADKLFPPTILQIKK